jgi:hypothetical protein
MKYIKRIYEFLMAAPATPTKPATPSTPTRPKIPGPKITPNPGEKEKPMAAWMAELTTKPKTPTKPATPSTPTRPDKPGPRIRPGEKEKEKPMAVLNGVLDQFFAELENIKDSKEGRSMIKKLHSKYVKKD